MRAATAFVHLICAGFIGTQHAIREGERHTMKRLFEHDTTKSLLIPFIISYLSLTPLVCDFGLAQSGAKKPVTIAHQPVRTAKRGQPLNVTAYVGSDKGISSVALKIDYDGKSVKGPMPPKKDGGVVPVIVQIINSDLDLFSGPGALYKRIGTVKRGDQLLVTAHKDGYYRIITPSKMVGYIDAEKTAVILSGNVFGVTIPASMTQGTLSYQIIAKDAAGQVAQSEIVNVSLLTDEELAALRSKPQAIAKTEEAQPQVVGAQGKTSRPFYAKPWFWLGIAAVGGGAYYYTTQKESKEEDATVNVSVGWN